MPDVYDRDAQRFFDQYQSVSFESVHQSWLSRLPLDAGLALDVGAGSGRDAASLAERGWDVIAVEPAQELQRLGKQHTEALSVRWLNDSLPELSKVRALSLRFNLILLSAVWMHVPSSSRERAFRILSELLAPGGMLVITLRHGPDDGERDFYPVSRGELELYSRRRALVEVPVSSPPSDDKLQRPGVTWETVIFTLPDDGTGALPTIRHIIINDSKFATYKLGLIRTLVRIAESAPGLVIKRTDDWVDIPLGAVGLFWISLYHPLVLKHRLRQAPGQRGYGFAKDDFYQLVDVSPLDFRVGMRLSDELAPVVLKAIRTAATNILANPARYATWPGTDRPIFEGEAHSFRVPQGAARLDRETLCKFGTFRVPANLWDAFSQFSCWIEPAIINEWVDLMSGWQVRYSMDSFYQAMRWQEGRRDTSVARRLVEGRLGQGAVECVWSGRRLTSRQYAIDHCFPWSRWSNNDLWNLLPASVSANAAKSEKLPSEKVMKEARPLILDWWQSSVLTTAYREQFISEAQASLPLLDDDVSPENVFEAMLHQRLRLKTNLQLAEWLGVNR